MEEKAQAMRKGVWQVRACIETGATRLDLDWCHQA
jgi:hypothetical protein